MITLPTRQRLLERRNELYTYLHSIIHCGSIHQVEDVMRKIHIINQKLKTYFICDHEPKEIFND